MTLPTRAQITRNFNQPKYRVEIDHQGTFYQIPDDHILSINGSMISSGNIQNGLSFGSYVEPSASVTVLRRLVLKSAHPSITYGYDDSYWINRRIRISQAFETSTYKPIFIGVITSYNITGEDLVYEIVGVLEYFRNIKFYTTIFYNRPIATLTTASSIEDPSAPGYAAGIINRIFWEAGGRPWERFVDYSASNPPFWYSCNQSLINPEWLWVSGENLVDEMFLLARATGGQIYESVDVSGGAGYSVLRFINPLAFADTTGYTSYYNFSESTYGNFSKSLSIENIAGKVTCKFATRRIQPLQDVYSDKTPYLFLPSETKTFTCNTSLPVFEYETITNSVVSAFQTITSAAATLSVTVTSQYAGQVVLSVTNSGSFPVVMTGITLRGKPLAVDEDGEVEVGSTTPVQTIEDNPYIQSRSHALQLATMVHTFFSSARRIITLSNCIYDPDRFVGELVQINNIDNVTYNGTTFVQDTTLYRIIRISHNATGTSMDIDLITVDGMLKTDDMYIVGNSYVSTDNKKVSF